MGCIQQWCRYIYRLQMMPQYVIAINSQRIFHILKINRIILSCNLFEFVQFKQLLKAFLFGETAAH